MVHLLLVLCKARCEWWSHRGESYINSALEVTGNFARTSQLCDESLCEIPPWHQLGWDQSGTGASVKGHRALISNLLFPLRLLNYLTFVGDICSWGKKKKPGAQEKKQCLLTFKRCCYMSQILRRAFFFNLFEPLKSMQLESFAIAVLWANVVRRAQLSLQLTYVHCQYIRHEIYRCSNVFK